FADRLDELTVATTNNRACSFSQRTLAQIARRLRRVDVQQHDAALCAEVERDQPIFSIYVFLAEPSGELVNAARLFLDLGQLDVAHVARLAGFPNEVKLDCFERHVGVNRSGIRLDDSGLNAADHINRARLPFDLDFGARWNRDDDIDA